jgi:uncharacterized protein YyaL (SSP411 family)
MRVRTLVLFVALLAATAAACRRSPAEPPYTNRLINETSPYLQQHAHNPVDWYPWGEEAFARARREDKPIFLSIGYSTCHWCHVMEAESFSNAGIAAFMNEHFVSIKVDREERPDLDRIYMSYVIGVSEGGWPMSVFLTPELKPFFGANYLPPDDRDREVGFRRVLQQVNTLWRTDRAAALRAAEEGTQAMELRSRATTGGANANLDQVLAQSYRDTAASFDGESGGFGGAPKFPRPVVLNFLLRYYARTEDQKALDMTLATLRAMATGGIRDQLGGGFHRYATDRAWQVPHFEKMLYDQAQLITAYVEAYQASGDRFFADVARDTIAYVMRDMRDAAGGFYSAEDADSRLNASSTDMGEGAYYVWTVADLQRVAGTDGQLASDYYGIEPGAAQALSSRRSLTEIAARLNRSDVSVRQSLDAARRALLQERARRPRPHRDEKVIVAWNGLMMSALARAANAFGDRSYLDAALANARFVETNLYDARSGRLTRRYAQGIAAVDGLLEDYALLVQGLLDLYEASFEPKWLAMAIRLQQTQDELFWDAADGAYFSTPAGARDVLTRAKEEYDGAEPSGNSVSAMNLLRLWRITAGQTWRDRFDGTIRALSPRLSRSGTALPQLLAAIELTRSRAREIVIAGDRNASDTQALLRLVHDRFLPNKIVIVTDDGEAGREVRGLVPFIDGMSRRDGRATIYVCENYACRLPTSDPSVAATLLN